MLLLVLLLVLVLVLVVLVVSPPHRAPAAAAQGHSDSHHQPTATAASSNARALSAVKSSRISADSLVRAPVPEVPATSMTRRDRYVAFAHMHVPHAFGSEWVNSSTRRTIFGDALREVRAGQMNCREDARTPLVRSKHGAAHRRDAGLNPKAELFAQAGEVRFGGSDTAVSVVGAAVDCGASTLSCFGCVM